MVAGRASSTPATTGTYRSAMTVGSGRPQPPTCRPMRSIAAWARRRARVHRHSKRSVWIVVVGVLGDEVLATAILDRLLHHCDVININGPSYRLKDRLTLVAGGEPMP